MAPQTQPSSSSSRQFTNQIRSLHSIILQRHSSRKAAFSGSVPSSQKSPENRQESTMEKVYRYTRDLALSRDKKVVKRAFERLLQLDCSSQIFKNAKTLKTAIKYPGSTPCFNREIHLLKLKIEKLEKRDQQLNAMEYDPFNPAGMSNFNGQEMDKLMAKFPIYIPTQIGQKINKSSEQEEEEYDPFFAIFDIPNDSRKMEILDLFAIYTPTPI
ncbi:hypothetical protein L3Y34_017001 [Caenorhabditis briggsae]|uniref:Uncharacterized protein n=1 Tax=Caenorhabditis briggsae TaxID=6238 RepID=A0AAE9DHJ2_CAEBR|nr:hypothetical protein L3Y34_017001 [Caenorhabditis briggsae]